jgi:undecaprenyl-diphosphatase
LTDRIGTRFAGRHPALIAWVLTIAAYLVLLLLMVGTGLLLTHVLQHGAVGRWDSRVDAWFVSRRTTALNAWTRAGSELGATGTVIGVGTAVIVLLAIARRWRQVGLIFFAVLLEVWVFVTTTFIVDRPRPPVPRLDVAPPTSSFPSGHVAAAIALYVGLAIVISTLVRNAVVRAIVWLVAILLPIAVGLSRVYRGMHHPTDVLASVVLGCGSLVATIFAVRCASAAARSRALSAPDRSPAAARS